LDISYFSEHKNTDYDEKFDKNVEPLDLVN